MEIVPLSAFACRCTRVANGENLKINKYEMHYLCKRWHAWFIIWIIMYVKYLPVRNDSLWDLIVHQYTVSIMLHHVIISSVSFLCLQWTSMCSWFRPEASRSERTWGTLVLRFWSRWSEVHTASMAQVSKPHWPITESLGNVLTPAQTMESRL